MLLVLLESAIKQGAQKNGKKKNTSRLLVGQVRIDFTSKTITPYGGIASVIAKFIEKIDFRSWVESSMPVEEKSNNGGGIYEKVLGQFLITLCGGFRFGHLWFDRGMDALLATFGVKWLPSAASTLTRFWGKIKTQLQAEQLGESARALSCRLLQWCGATSGSLRFDSSVITLYGNQEGARKGYNPKKPGRKSHHPLLAFVDGGFVVNLWNRSGDTFAGHRAIDFFNQTFTSLAKISYKVRRVLCDSGFYLIEFIEHLENKGLTYIMAARIYRPLQNRIMKIENWERVTDGIEVGDFWFEHEDEKWDKPRRYVAVRQFVPERPQATGKQLNLFVEFEQWKNYRISLFITNDHESSPEKIWRDYRPRATDENVIKELKENYGMAAFNMKNFWATEAVMVIEALVFHNMIQFMNRNLFNKNGISQTLQTLRSKYFVIGAQLGSGGRKKVLRLSVTDRKLKSKIIWIMEQIHRMPETFNCIAFDTS